MKKLIPFIFVTISCIIFSQEKVKDTLHVKFNNSFLSKFQYPNDTNVYYMLKGTGNNGFVNLLKIKSIFYLNPKNVLCFRDILKESKAYYKKGKIDDWKLANYLGKFVIILVKDKEYILVQPVYEIE